MKNPPESKIGVYEIFAPSGELRVPIIIDLPHSGTLYPPDFNYDCPKEWLERSEERYLDELFIPPLLEIGGAAIKASFPRTYVDPNRAESDIDPLLIDDEWTAPPPPDGRAKYGHGIVMRQFHEGEHIYNRKLTLKTVRDRIENYYSCYHNALNELLERSIQEFGSYLLLSCHSTPSAPIRSQFPNQTPDIILGDLDGRSCKMELRQEVRQGFEDFGYRVSINHIYRGAEIVSRYGQPAWNRNALQIEINRTAFQNEETLKKTKKFKKLKDDIKIIIQGMAEK